MGNPRTSTKVRPIVPEKAVRNYIACIFHEGQMRKFLGRGETCEVGFHETWIWEERPTFSDPHYTKVTFHGCTHLSSGWAKYEGKFGTWVIDIAPEGSFSIEQPCTRVWGNPHCTHPSDEWRETPDQRRVHLAQLFEQFPMNEAPHERWSWYKVG